MKRLIFLNLLIVIMFCFYGCYITHPEPHVSACFSTQYRTYEVEELIFLDNCSVNADRYRWEFGDGTMSTNVNPEISYYDPGEYVVTLTAYNNASRDVAETVLTIVPSTDLDVLVMYYGTEDPVSDCEVTLYVSEQDWVHFEDPLISGYTGHEGIIIFRFLDPIRYWIDAYKGVDGGFYSNDELGVVTDPLIESEINYVDIYVEYFTNAKREKAYKVVQVKKGSPDHPLRQKSEYNEENIIELRDK